MRTRSTHLRQSHCDHSRPAFALTLSVVMAAAVTTVIIVTMAYTSISQIDNTAEQFFGLQNTLQSESCLQEALTRLRTTSEYSGGSLSTGDCGARVTTTTDEAYITVTSTWNNYHHTLYVTSTRSPLTIIEWDNAW